MLLDAPCSGLGVLAKKPDIKWKRDISDILKLTSIQTELIENAARLVKPGGVLVYSTCTTEPEENREVVNQFLCEQTAFKLEHERELLPFREAVDGAYVARLARP